MSKGGHGAAAASVLMLKKSEESKKQESALREAFKVDNLAVHLFCGSVLKIKFKFIINVSFMQIQKY